MWPYLAEWKCPLNLQEPISLQKLERSFNLKVFLMRLARPEQEKSQRQSVLELMMGHRLLSLAKVFVGCGGLTLAGCQVPTKAALSLPSTAGQGRENIMKGLWVEIRTGRSLSNYHHEQNRLDLGKKKSF